MSTFFINQLDFIFFFYGLAFILLGTTCLAIARSKDRGEAWAVLSGFAFVHGVGEWLDLSALIVGDGAAFAVVRVMLMTVSFVLLLDFARLEAIRLGVNLPGRWIYVPVVMLVALIGVTGGVTAASIAARYALAFPGALGASFVLTWGTRTLPASARYAGLCASIGFLLYAFAAGAIVPAAPFWPANIVNHGWFVSWVGAPIQLFRGLLACWIAFSIWAMWVQQLAGQLRSARYTTFVRQQFIWTLVAMGTILVSGWTLTEFLGGIYRQDVQEESRRDIDLLASRLSGDTASVDAMVKALAGFPSFQPRLTGSGRSDDNTAQSFLDLAVEASGARRGYILDGTGAVVASSNSRDVLPGKPSYGTAVYFRQSIVGDGGYQFVFDAATGARDYYASQPIRAADGKIVGVAVLTKSLDAFEADLREFSRPYFFIDPQGVVAMTNRPEALHRTLWPLAATVKTSLSRQFGKVDDHPMLEREVVDGTWATVDTEREYVRRRFADHSQWSLVILKPTREIFATRFLGIVITLLVTIMALIYLVGKGRWIHDDVLADNRVRLQELTQDLGVKATTDPLTGLHNRLNFDQALAREIERSQRYGTPLSLILYDIDHFKRVNDSYGHLIGDKVLVQLSRFVPNLIRTTDFLARWGGEEFVILASGSGGPMAFQAAEKLRDAVGQVVFEDVGTITCSFGVTQWVPGETAMEFIARADEALYHAKANGRNQVVLAPQSEAIKLKASPTGPL
ncbi:sensor domain-containing diguanylate cyclase [Pinirhizobacter soli]|uniref:sensor domain-containing diguanylate cyclase n=1 Tax=Pinirhizobacter soli TaxID=2786953 RepID=UPI002029E967|nr:sensor domain-containing diguanylate cyclase [Pinirhizobacter soli]